MTLAQLGNTQVLTCPVGLAGSARGGGGRDEVRKGEASSCFCEDQAWLCSYFKGF